MHKSWKSIKNVKKSKKMKIVWEWFYDEISKHIFSDEKQIFWPNRFNISLNLPLENDKYGPTTQKQKMGWKRQKLESTLKTAWK